MTDLTKLSAKKLHEVINKRYAEFSAALDETISAGLGDVRFNDMVELAKGSSLCYRSNLARKYLNTRLDWRNAADELDARRAYHGGDKPIKRVV